MTNDPLEPEFTLKCSQPSFLLKALAPLNKQESMIVMSQDGLRFITCLEASTCQMMSYLSRDLFSFYDFRQENSLVCCLDLSGLIEILSMFTNQESNSDSTIKSELVLSFSSVDCELHLNFTNVFQGMNVECCLGTLDSQLNNTQVIEAFHEDPCTCKLIIKVFYFILKISFMHKYSLNG